MPMRSMRVGAAAPLVFEAGDATELRSSVLTLSRLAGTWLKVHMKHTQGTVSLDSPMPSCVLLTVPHSARLRGIACRARS
jgi:hypothetical protein